MMIPLLSYDQKTSMFSPHLSKLSFVRTTAACKTLGCAQRYARLAGDMAYQDIPYPEPILGQGDKHVAPSIWPHRRDGLARQRGRRG